MLATQSRPSALKRAVFTLAVGLLSSNALAASDEILFGQSAALSGLASELGKDLQLGIEAAFFEANSNGGVGGRTIWAGLNG